MDWAFDHHSCFYRSGFDLSLPLMPKVLFPEFAPTPATDRKYFLTFKVRTAEKGGGTCGNTTACVERCSLALDVGVSA